MARCGACSARTGVLNRADRPVVIGEENDTVSRVRVVGHGGPEHPSTLAAGKAYFVTGDGVDPLLEAGVLTLA